MNIVVVGQGGWCTDLAKGICRFTTATARSIPIDHVLDTLELLHSDALRTADLIVRVGVRPGSHTARGRGFDALFAAASGGAHDRTAYLWLGTDVYGALKEAAAGERMTRFRSLTAGARHVAVSFQLRDELAGLGVDAAVAWIPPRHPLRKGDPPPLPSHFTVLSYVPDFRHEFYGGPALVDVADRLPDIAFRIISGHGDWVRGAPANLAFLGHVGDVAEEFSNCSCLVRMVEHDGFSGTVVEALSYGRPVIYSMRFPHTHHVDFGDVEQLEAALIELMEGAHREPSSQDVERSRWAQRVSDEAECYEILLRALGGGPGREGYDFPQERA